MKRIITAVMAVLLLACVTAATAANAGTSSDPLVTLSYINDEYIPAVLAQGEALIDTKLAQVSVSDESQTSPSDEGYSFSSGYEAYKLPNNESLQVIMGSSVILTGGSARVSSIEGTMINVSTGLEVAEGTALTLNNRYFCAEDTAAVIITPDWADVSINGYYIVSEYSGEPEKPVQFSDVAASAWYVDAVNYVVKNGLMSGYGGDVFAPEDTLSRAMLAQILYNSEGKPAAGNSGFDDVTSANWYADAVAWASEKGLVTGYGNGLFGGDDAITREQLAVILYRYAVYKGYNVSARADLSGYSDGTSISGYAVEAMQWANAEGLVTGITETTLFPAGNATRAQVATILMRFCENIAK